MLEFKLRSAEVTDINLILSLWLLSYAESREGRFVARETSRDTYFKGHQRIVKDIMDRATTLVACDIENPDIIYGFITYERDPANHPTVVHYIGTKRRWQQFGIAKRLMALIDDKNVFYSHQTRLGMLLKPPPHWTYDPYTRYP